MIDQVSMTAVQHTSKANRLSIAALLLAAVALGGMVLGGFAVIAVFAVGAGHMALQQIATRGERGNVLAIISLVIGYGIGLYALINAIYFGIVFAQQPH
jgi:hypothetical protein